MLRNDICIADLSPDTLRRWRENTTTTSTPLVFKPATQLPKSDICVADLSTESLAKWQANRK